MDNLKIEDLNSSQPEVITGKVNELIEAVNLINEKKILAFERKAKKKK